jgi:hypothetical protein
MILIMNSECRRICKIFATYFKVISEHSLGQNEAITHLSQDIEALCSDLSKVCPNIKRALATKKSL